MVPLVDQVLEQTRRRVVAGEAVPASEKLVSIFEPHTAIICRGKAGKPTEFGHKIWLDEVDGGIITRATVLEGNPLEAPQLPVSIAQHHRLFGHAPDLVTADRETGRNGSASSTSAGSGKHNAIVPGSKAASVCGNAAGGWDAVVTIASRDSIGGSAGVS
jgi:hypothetical protein